jgi:hypothetical protein
MRKNVVLAFGLCSVLFASAPAFAQADNDSSQWGITVGVAPNWRVPKSDNALGKLAERSITLGDLGYHIEGVDFRAGVVRGQAGRGNWGMGLVRRTFTDDSRQGAIVEQCILGVSCFVEGTEYRYQDASLTGVEAETFLPVVSIRDVVSVGLSFGIGAGWYQGMAEKREATNEFTESSTEPITGFRSEEVPASELSTWHPTILGRAEVTVAVRLTSRLDVKVSAGLNYPGVNVGRVSLAYFFGSN